MKSSVSKNDGNNAPTLRCPKCGSTDIAEIVYGAPAMTEQLLRRVQRKEAVIRPGARSNTAPRYYCNYCGYEW